MKKMLCLLLCYCTVATLFSFSACAAEQIGPPAPKPAVNAAGMPLIPDFTLPLAGGEQVSLSDYAGKQVVLYFWASWCAVCKESMPARQALQDWMVEREFPGVVLAVNLTDGMQETRESCDAYIAAQGFTMPVLYEENGALANMMGITSIPATVFIDAEGYLKNGALGPMPLEEMQKILEEPA